ncbi:hypothetical protein D5I55_02545 [Chakrabartia godavariana]|nr:hypothetical protein D5I55_02545 [Chakrabartia godavariana]
MRRDLILATHGVGHPFRHIVRARVKAAARRRAGPDRFEGLRFFTFTYSAAFVAVYTFLS